MPPGIEKKKTGSVIAVCSKAIKIGELVNEVMSQAAATICIHDPTLEVMLTIQKNRKTGWRRGLNVLAIHTD